MVGETNIITDDGSYLGVVDGTYTEAEEKQSTHVKLHHASNSNPGNNHSSTNQDARLDAAWADAEREVDRNRRKSSSNDLPMEDGITEMMNGEYDVSPLMAHPSDATLQTSNITSSSLLSNHNHMLESSISNEANPSDNVDLIPTNDQTISILQKYRHFLLKHEPSLDMVESVMERFVFYGLLFKHDHRGISTEMYYATWNIIRWMNDVVLVGWGEGMGTTVGRREEWLSSPPVKSSSTSKIGASISEALLLRMNSVVPMIRVILTATTCIYPAMEAWSRRSQSLHSFSSHGTPLLLDSDEEYQMMATTTDLSPRKRRLEWEARQGRAAQVSYRLERVRFLARLALLSISWWARHRRRSFNEDGDNTKHTTLENEREMPSVPSLLRRGGELDPYEQMVPLKDAEDEANVVQYVGRRTGRRSVARNSIALSPQSSFMSKGSAIIKWISGLMSCKNRIIYIYAVGELLHILRPLYWSHAEKSQWQRRSPSLTIPRIQPKSNRGSSYSFAIWKAWWISLLMDLISDKLLQATRSGDSTPSNQSQQCRGSLLTRGGGRHHGNNTHQLSPSLDSPSAEQAKLEELGWRRSRHNLYLLRSPMYNTVTRPLATLLGKMVSMIPSFGLGRFASEYVLDMMSYWNDHHFMLES